MSQFYTGRGDDGTTGLLGEGRVHKNDAQIELLGTLDETSAALGLARATCHAERITKLILQIQRHLYLMMAEVAATPENADRFHNIDADKVAWLEGIIETFGKLVRMPKEFLVPGDSQGEAALALSRTIIRRAERRAVELFREGKLTNSNIQIYLNRASSLIFLFEIFEHFSLKRTGPTLAKVKEENDHDRNIA